MEFMHNRIGCGLESHQGDWVQVYGGQAPDFSIFFFLNNTRVVYIIV